MSENVAGENFAHAVHAPRETANPAAACSLLESCKVLQTSSTPLSSLAAFKACLPSGPVAACSMPRASGIDGAHRMHIDPSYLPLDAVMLRALLLPVEISLNIAPGPARGWCVHETI